MAPAEPRPRFDAAAYLAWEAEQPERHEFVDGEVCAMTGARDAHNRVALNVAFSLKQALRGTPGRRSTCFASTPPMACGCCTRPAAWTPACH